ncbi:uncharacterized protein LOC116255930 [Nymphaea colorata]|uniref:uncharacterized protein LOC116255930 n=1 Tax=Nymphaea colorata TaxID=210225 RepID=UPI00129DB9A0|nr:uncharacterized protein LOC116255930 [Nymphaea colorata]
MLALTLERLMINKSFSILGDKPTNEERRTYEAFETDNLMAKTIMSAFMKDDLIKVFEDSSIAKEMFDFISSKYNTTTTMHIQLLLEQYNSYKMNEPAKMVDHVIKMLVMAKDLAVVGNVISDNMLISTILNSLPHSWEMAVTTLSLQFNTLTLEKLLLQLAIQQEHLAKRKDVELMTVHDKFASSHILVIPKQFKKKNDGKFKDNL